MTLSLYIDHNTHPFLQLKYLIFCLYLWTAWPKWTDQEQKIKTFSQNCTHSQSWNKQLKLPEQIHSLLVLHLRWYQSSQISPWLESNHFRTALIKLIRLNCRFWPLGLKHCAQYILMFNLNHSLSCIF